MSKRPPLIANNRNNSNKDSQTVESIQGRGMDKKKLSESDLCDKFIRPAMQTAGWNGLDQIFREYPLRAGRVTVRGNTAHRDQSTVRRADYALFFKSSIPLAVVEAKDNGQAMGAGMAHSPDLHWPRKKGQETASSA